MLLTLRLWKIRLKFSFGVGFRDRFKLKVLGFFGGPGLVSQRITLTSQHLKSGLWVDSSAAPCVRT